MHTRLKHHLPIPSQYRKSGAWVKGMRCVVQRWGEKGAYFEVPAQALLGEMSYWGDISPKRSKHELEPLDACYRGW